MNFIRLRRIKRFGQRDLHNVAVQSDRDAAIHACGGRRDDIQQFGGNLLVADRDHLGAEIGRLDVQDVVQLHYAEVLQDLDRGRVAALDLGGDILVLEVVNQPLLFDEREQRT